MGAFIGYGQTGVWASNSERNAFLDWYAAHRCQPCDGLWEHCMSEAWRWPGCCIDLGALIPSGEVLEITEAELSAAAAAFWPQVARLLNIISRITMGEWDHSVGSTEAAGWRIS